MTLSNEIQTFLDSQIEYYINEAKSYREMAKEYNLDDSSVSDTAFGIIVGCIYSSLFKHTQTKIVPQTHKMLKNLLK